MPNLGEAVLSLIVNAKGMTKGLADAEKKAVKRTKEIGKKMTVAVTGPILAIGAAVLKSVDTMDKAMATIRTGTGATGEALKGLQTDFEAVFKAAPVDAQAAAAAVADFNTELGLTGEPLQQAARAAVELGADVGLVGRAMKLFNVDGEQATATMDKIFVTSQATGRGFNDLTRDTQTYGPVLKNLGFSLDETIAFMGSMHSSGVDISRVMPGINAATRRWAEDGVTDLKGALFDTVEQIKGASTETEALNIATETFGAEGAQRMTVAIRNGALEFGNLVQAMEGADGAIIENANATRTLSDRWQMGKNRLQSFLNGFSSLPGGVQIATIAVLGIVAAVGPLLVMLPSLVSGAKLAGTGLKTLARITKIQTAAQWLLNAAMSANPIAIVIIAVTALAAAGVVLWQNWDTVRTKLDWIWGQIGGTVESTVNWIIRIVNGMTLVYREALVGILTGIEKLASAAAKFGIVSGDTVDAIRKIKEAIDRGIPSVDIYTQKTEEAAEASNQAADASANLATAEGEAGQAAADATPPTQAFGDAVGTVGEKADTTADKIERWHQKQEVLRTGVMDVNEATAGLLPTLAELESKLRAEEQALKDVAETAAALEEQLSQLGPVSDRIARQIEWDDARKTRAAEAHVEALDVAAENAAAAAQKRADAEKSAADAILREQARLMAGWDRYTLAQDATVAAANEAGVSFGDVVTGMADNLGISALDMRDRLIEAGVNWGDWAALIAAENRGLIDATIADLARAQGTPVNERAAYQRQVATEDAKIKLMGIQADRFSSLPEETRRVLVEQHGSDALNQVGGRHLLSPEERQLIPEMAQGGFAMRPMLANIGEAGPEAVIPLDRMMDMGADAGTTISFAGANIYGFDDFEDAVSKAQLTKDRRGRQEAFRGRN